MSCQWLLEVDERDSIDLCIGWELRAVLMICDMSFF